MRIIERSGAFKSQYKLMIKRGCNENDIKSIILKLATDESLPPKNRDHQLTGNFAGFRECHIKPDWLLIYKKMESENNELILRLEATGTHSDLF